ncbi:hydrogen peroxide-inducible genes activator [Chondrinema litorale]|uniref:hydrogen peroxide-inducible genes activator n=1 Tax=Chondrinema litorale TaxID=2994555 RepID=UPI0025448108|nr:hydrogen peroxide-inducible genes activator [Chondrinema litorale]UZR93929.1 LysR substrate-binding domain-containing protein [Chondrinema litorale]
MTLQQLQYVVALDNHRHFVKAAESCFVAQPTLTLQVKKLEDEIGLVLFDRSAQPLKPTPLGISFISKAREILREVDALKNMVNTEKEVLEGTFRLGVIPTLAPYLLPLFIKQFSEDHPAISLEVKEMQSNEIISGLKNESLDIGLMVTPVNDNAIREYVLFYEPFLVYTSEENTLFDKEEVSATDIIPDGLWLLNQGHCFRNQVLNICNTSNLSAHKGLSFESGSIETLKNLVRYNYGYTLVPELSIHKKIDDPFLRRFSEPQPAREVSIVVHQSFARELLMERLRQAILNVVPDNFKKNKKFLKIQWR